VPLTKEEVRRRKLVRAAMIAATVTAILIALAIAFRLKQRHDIEVATTEAEREGRVAAIEAALALLDGEDSAADRALRARLHAMAAIAGVEEHREQAGALLASHDANGDGASDHRIAATYLALAAGDPSAAGTEASRLVAGQGPRGAEAGHARALAALALGNIEAARSAADAAVGNFPNAPRHQALVLEVASRQTTSVEMEPGESTPLRIARARARWERDLGRDEAIADAQDVLSATDATPSERAWAELIVAQSIVAQGNTVGATEALTRAEESTPPGDELFTMEVADAWMALGRLDRAQRRIAQLGSGVSTDAGRRGLLLARLALVTGDWATAESMANVAQPSPRRTYVEAEIAAARGQTDQAIALFRQAGETPDLQMEAMCALSGLLVRSGHADEALAPVEPLLARDPNFPRVAAAAAYAQAAQGDKARALATLETALAVHAREPVLLAAKARVFYQASEWQPAVEAYAQAMEVDDGDVAVATERGISARHLYAAEPANTARLDEARTSFERAIELVPGHRLALTELLSLSLETSDLPRARRAMEGLDGAHAEGLEIDLLRARFLVLARAGASGVAAVEAACGRHADNGDLRFYLGQLYYQAEDFNDAVDAFYAASTRETSLRREALAMRALTFGRARREPSIEPAITLLRVGTSGEPLSAHHEALALLASAWMEWHNEVVGRATIFAREAIEREPDATDALLLLGYIDALQRRDAAPRMREAARHSLEAQGWLAVNVDDASRCESLEAYVTGAPQGRFAVDATRLLRDQCHAR
jgi:tetratricopeptide (TPR) repeat protein